MVNPPSFLLSIHAHAQSLEAVCFFGTTWSVLYVLCNSTSVCSYTEWSICPEEEDVTCRGSLFAHVFFGALPAVCSDRIFSRPLWISMSDDGHIALLYDGPSGVPSPSSIVLPLKTGDVDGLGLGGLASWWLHCLAPRSPLTAYCVARAHAHGLTAAFPCIPDFAWCHSGGGRADGGVRAIRLG